MLKEHWTNWDSLYFFSFMFPNIIMIFFNEHHYFVLVLSLSFRYFSLNHSALSTYVDNPKLAMKYFQISPLFNNIC